MNKLKFGKEDFISALILILATIALLSSLATISANSELVKATQKLEMYSTENDFLQLEKNSLAKENLEITSKTVILTEHAENLENQIDEMRDEIESLNEEYEAYKLSVSTYPINLYNISESELNVLYRLVEAENTGQSFISKVNTTHIILNRVLHNKFPDDIINVTFQDRQFSCITDGRYYEVVIQQSTIDAVNYALRSNDTTDGSLFFMQRSASDKSNVDWFDSRLEFTMQDDSGHEFWKIKED